MLMVAKREFGGNQAKHGAQPMALERARPMTDLRTYISESGWGKRYDLPFGGRGSEPRRIDAQSAQPACAEGGSDPRSIDARSAQPACAGMGSEPRGINARSAQPVCARCSVCTCSAAVTNMTGGQLATTIDQEKQNREVELAMLASWQLDSVKAAPKLKGKFVSLELFALRRVRTRPARTRESTADTARVRKETPPRCCIGCRGACASTSCCRLSARDPRG